MAPYRYKFILVARQSEGTDSTGYPPWLYGLEKVYLDRLPILRSGRAFRRYNAGHLSRGRVKKTGVL